MSLIQTFLDNRLNMPGDFDYEVFRKTREYDEQRLLEKGKEILQGKYDPLDGCRYMFLGLKSSKPKKTLMPKDVKRVIIRKRNVTVELTDGKKGTAKCDEIDAFDPYVGFCIAYFKAHNKGNHRLKQALCACIQRADKKGYKNAILNNREV